MLYVCSIFFAVDIRENVYVGIRQRAKQCFSVFSIETVIPSSSLNLNMSGCISELDISFIYWHMDHSLLAPSKKDRLCTEINSLETLLFYLILNNDFLIIEENYLVFKEKYNNYFFPG